MQVPVTHLPQLSKFCSSFFFCFSTSVHSHLLQFHLKCPSIFYNFFLSPAKNYSGVFEASESLEYFFLSLILLFPFVSFCFLVVSLLAFFLCSQLWTEWYLFRFRFFFSACYQAECVGISCGSDFCPMAWWLNSPLKCVIWRADR